MAKLAATTNTRVVRSVSRTEALYQFAICSGLAIVAAVAGTASAVVMHLA